MESVLKKRNIVAGSASMCGALQNQTWDLIELNILWCTSHLCES